MAGLWNLIAATGEADERLSNHLFDAALALYGTDDITAAAAKTALEGILGRAFTSPEETDVNAIAAELNGQSDVQAKLVYMSKIMAAGIAAENGCITEAKWRSILGID